MKSKKWGGPIFISLSILVLVLTAKINKFDLPNSDILRSQSQNTLPNIIIITADGVNANNMSAYGYDRQTTPFLDSFLDNSLIAENAFSNSGNTAGSLTSMYTGKYPANTRVLNAPDILKNNDSVEHLLSILKALGYSTTQFSFPYYADAYDRNLRYGFDTANGRKVNNSGMLSWLLNHLDSNESFFLTEVCSSLIDRLSHIFYFSNMQNPGLLIEGDPHGSDDQFKFDEAINILEQTDKPVFIHIHYMETHGFVFYPEANTFSLNKDVEDQEKFDVDFYDDAILDFDNSLRLFFEKIKKINKYENTIFIIASDHGQGYTTNQKIPFIIHFPNDEFTGKIYGNVQNIDIAPTILDYLNIEKPDWMEGDSLLSGDLENRPIYGVGVNNVNPDGLRLITSENFPPFYQFGYITVNYCNAYYKLMLKELEWYSGSIEGYVGQCDTITDEQAYQLMVDHLAKYDFDTSSLSGFSSVKQKY